MGLRRSQPACDGASSHAVAPRIAPGGDPPHELGLGLGVRAGVSVLEEANERRDVAVGTEEVVANELRARFRSLLDLPLFFSGEGHRYAKLAMRPAATIRSTGYFAPRDPGRGRGTRVIASTIHTTVYSVAFLRAGSIFHPLPSHES